MMDHHSLYSMSVYVFYVDHILSDAVSPAKSVVRMYSHSPLDSVTMVTYYVGRVEGEASVPRVHTVYHILYVLTRVRTVHTLF